MSREEIEPASAQLPASEVAKLAKWFAEFRARVRGGQLAQGVEAGRLDALTEQAEKDFEQGRCEPL